MNHHSVELKDVKYSYPDGTIALKSISINIKHGESVAIVGSNGSGKTTLLSLLSGVLISSEGMVRIGEHQVTKKTLAKVRRIVGMVFQNPDDQLFMPTVYDDVAFGPNNLGLSPTEIETHVTKALETVGALELKNRPPYRLSGGQKRAVAIASVLAMNPFILVMDEPTAALDPFARRKLINLLYTFTHTKIIATHDLDMALDVCERTIVLDNGNIFADGSTFDIFRDKDLLRRAHLEQPLSMQGCAICSTYNKA